MKDLEEWFRGIPKWGWRIMRWWKLAQVEVHSIDEKKLVSNKRDKNRKTPIPEIKQKNPTVTSCLIVLFPKFQGFMFIFEANHHIQYNYRYPVSSSIHIIFYPSGNMISLRSGFFNRTIHPSRNATSRSKASASSSWPRASPGFAKGQGAMGKPLVPLIVRVAGWHVYIPYHPCIVYLPTFSLCSW